MLKSLTSLLVVALAVSAIHCQSVQVITVDNGETEGRWGPLETCPPGSRAISYQSSHEVDVPVVDDSALNTILLICNDANSTIISSTQG